MYNVFVTLTNENKKEYTKLKLEKRPIVRIGKNMDIPEVNMFNSYNKPESELHLS